MTSVSAFNEMMDQFLSELKQTFPEEKSIKKYYTGFDILRKANPRKCIVEFMEQVSPYANHIMQKDDSFFLTPGAKVPKIIEDLGVRRLWTPELSQTTKDAIWQYLQTLYMLGTTITSIPAETLTMIERVAKQCAETMQGGEGIDEKALMSSMSGLFGNLLKDKN